MEYHPDKARGNPELFKDISDVKTQLEKEQDPVMVARMMFDGTYGIPNSSNLVPYERQSRASSADASFQRSHRKKLSCHNCKKEYLIEEYPWQCVTVGNYRREMLRKWNNNATYEKPREFWSNEWSRFQNSKNNVCVFCRREPEDGDAYVCERCRIKVGCRGCCNMKWQREEVCPLCDSQDW
uniref:J domain-containing protein n=1 Tax=Panagrolaimus davidi TaxID=227884 RepID=A0A914PRX6_9BILA